MLLLGLVFVVAALFWARYNAALTRRAGEANQDVLALLYQQIPKVSSWDEFSLEAAGELSDQPDYVVNPQMPMPVCEINGVLYIGYLSIPALNLELSVASACDYDTLDISPCRYSGSAYEGNLVLSAHNYGTHFGSIGSLQLGSPVYFTDMDGNVFKYRVSKQEVLLPTDSELMVQGEFPLTLFTCTVGGSYRVTVRCDYMHEEESA